MCTQPTNGSRRLIDGTERVFYDGYWIKAYAPPQDTLQTKRALIQALTRRLFNHVEHGINIPGTRLAEARAAFEAEQDESRRRVNAAMLAGALFNRAADIFTSLVDLQSAGVEIRTDNSLMRECGQCLLEALERGRMVRHRGGDEGIDELWGEPFKVFSMSVEDFYESRYVKIAMTMRDIDRIAEVLKETFVRGLAIDGVEVRIDEMAEAAKRKCEILRTDPVIFEVWPAFVVASDALRQVTLPLPPNASACDTREAIEGVQLLRQGVDLISDIVRARVPMPKSTRDYIARCERYQRMFIGPTQGDGADAGALPSAVASAGDAVEG